MTGRVLFVDDEAAMLRCLERTLGGDYEVFTADSAAAALDLILSPVRIPVVVTDMRMPKMDGLQLIQAARAAGSDAAFIMLTGNQDGDTSARAQREAGVARLLTKPCRGEDLRDAIDAALDRRPSGVE